MRSSPLRHVCLRLTSLRQTFHHSGRYLLSGGMDTVVNLVGRHGSEISVFPCTLLTTRAVGDSRVPRRQQWDGQGHHHSLPALLKHRSPHRLCGLVIQPPIHLADVTTEEAAADLLSLRFYDDLILSRSAKENKILLWKIDGFSSSGAVPAASAAPPPTSGSAIGTRSAFGGRFQLLLQFDAPATTLFYMRFGLFHQPHKHPILAMGNEKSKLFFWDLQRLEEGGAADGKDEPAFKLPRRKGRGDALGETREQSIVSNASSGAVSSSNSSAPPEKKFTVRDPFALVAAHKAVTVPKIGFAVRQIAWSNGGEWCVAVGDCGMICLFRRWE